MYGRELNSSICWLIYKNFQLYKIQENIH